MKAAKKDLYIEAGATFVLPIRWCARDKTNPEVLIPHDLTGAEARMQIRRKATDAEVLWEATTENGRVTLGWDYTAVMGTPHDPTNGWIVVWMTSVQSASLQEVKKGVYDIEVVIPASGDRREFTERIAEGAVSISANVTRVSDDG